MVMVNLTNLLTIPSRQGGTPKQQLLARKINSGGLIGIRNGQKDASGSEWGLGKC